MWEFVYNWISYVTFRLKPNIKYMVPTNRVTVDNDNINDTALHISLM